MKSAFQHTIFTYFVLGFLSLLFFNIAIFDFIEDAFKDFSYLDLVQSKNIFKYDKVISDVIIVNIEDRDREELAYLIEHISKQKPKVIGMDIIFKEPRNSYQDSILSTTIKKNQSFLVGAYIYPEIKNWDSFQLKKQGFINLNHKNKGNVIREYSTEINDSTSFAYEVALKGNSGIISKNPKYKPIKFYGNYKQFLHLSFDDVMRQDSLPVMKNKIVLLGYLGIPMGNVNDILDKKFTPINTVFSGKSIPDMYGVVIHANIIASLIKNDLILEVPKVIIIVLSFIFTFFTSLLFLKIHSKEYTNETLIEKLFQLIYTFFVLWVSVLFFTKSVKFSVTLIIICPILAIELLPYSNYFYKLLYRKWNFLRIN